MTYGQEVAQHIYESIDGRILVGQKSLIKYFLTCYFSRGHFLIQGPPGTGKTMAAKLFAHLSGKDFKRIQFTSDMLPSDIIGAHIYSPGTQDFKFVKGPIFTDFILADEINRTPPRTQSALLEAMEERQVTAEGHEFKLGEDLFVVATQNPRDFEGTFPLPESQLDRFIMQVIVFPTDIEKEQLVLKNFIDGSLPAKFDDLKPVNVDLNRVTEELKQIKIDDSLIKYISEIVMETRVHPLLQWGGSTRASIALLKTSRAWALLEGRDFVVPDDIKFLCPPVLRHRIRLTPEASISEVTPDEVIDEIIKKVKFPT